MHYESDVNEKIAVKSTGRDFGRIPASRNNLFRINIGLTSGG
jgi:hypothetical protein